MSYLLCVKQDWVITLEVRDNEHGIVKDNMLFSLVYLWCLAKYIDGQGKILPLTFESCMESPLEIHLIVYKLLLTYVSTA